MCVCACVDVRRGSCWVTVVDSRCEGSVHSHITKVECCSSVGVAWGSPCEKCPSHAEVIAVVGQATAVPFSPSIAPGQHLTITQCYLPPGRGDIPAFTPAAAGTRFSDPGGIQG